MVRRLGQAARPHRSVRVISVAAALTVVASFDTAGTPRGTRPPGAEQAAPATGEAWADPATASPTGTPMAEPFAAPSSPGAAVDPLDEAAARARRITDSTEDWASFTLADRRTGRYVGDSRSAQRTNSESIVKAWLAADLLATAAGEKRRLTAYERTRMASMIRVSDDDAAEVIWRWLGADGSIRRMIKVCRMTDTTVYPAMWSLTQISSRDMARLGVCLAPSRGKPLSRTASAQLLALMRSVDPSNAFGIQQAHPSGEGVRLAVKNGWTEHGGGEAGRWNVNCLAIWGPDLRWVLAVTLRYPIPRGLSYGADVCRRVTTALFP